jgi:tRNA(adenine34) deaminase
MKHLPDQHFMQMALTEAQQCIEYDEVPIGALITYQGQVIARSGNRIQSNQNPLAHAELLCLEQACQLLATKYLTECTLFCTLEPCIMCSGALVLARIGRLVFAAPEPKTGGIISKTKINSLGLNHKLNFEYGLLAEQSAQLLKKFFAKKR